MARSRPAKPLEQRDAPAPPARATPALVERRDFSVLSRLEIREESGVPKLVGHAAVFEQKSLPLGAWFPFREKIARGAFADSIASDDIVALWSHDPGQPLGRKSAGTLTLREDEVGLHVEIVPGETTWGRNALESVRRGDIAKMSFGFQVPKGGDRWDIEEDEDVRTLLRIKLLEVSPVAFPAYPQTDIGARDIGGVPAAQLLEALEAARRGRASLDVRSLLRNAGAALTEASGPSPTEKRDLMERQLRLVAMDL